MLLKSLGITTATALALSLPCSAFAQPPQSSQPTTASPTMQQPPPTPQTAPDPQQPPATPRTTPDPQQPPATPQTAPDPQQPPTTPQTTPDPQQTAPQTTPQAAPDPNRADPDRPLGDQTQPRSESQTASPQPAGTSGELPNTASPLSSIVLMAFSALGAARAVRSLRARQ